LALESDYAMTDLGGQTVGDLGEFGLISRLRAQMGAPSDERLVVGVGDDAAVWRSGAGYTIATTDTMVADVHFLPGRCAWRDVGWKALAVNVSDIAAMGGTPSFALVTVHLPAATPVADVDEMYAGLRECAEVYGVTVAGGDIVSSPVLAITVALAGEAVWNEQGQPLLLRRDAARAGDLVAVTGPLGGSAGGLRCLKREPHPPAPSATSEEVEAAVGATGGSPAVEQRLIERHMHPWPRVDAGNIAARAGIRCGIDISDGLVQDLGHICEASRVDAELRFDQIPLEPGLEQACPDDARTLAATGGEDYELVLVGGAGALQIAEDALRKHLSMPDTQQLTIVGRMTGVGEGRVRVLDAAGAEVALTSGGWDHLAKDRA
jgi:thiamine-monophosphate kinase